MVGRGIRSLCLFRERVDVLNRTLAISQRNKGYIWRHEMVSMFWVTDS